MRVDHYESLIAAYVNETLKAKDKARVEELIASDETFQKMYLTKKQIRDFYQELIPDFSVHKNVESSLKKEMFKVNEEVFPQNKLELLKKVMKFLNDPIIEI